MIVKVNDEVLVGWVCCVSAWIHLEVFSVVYGEGRRKHTFRGALCVPWPFSNEAVGRWFAAGER